MKLALSIYLLLFSSLFASDLNGCFNSFQPLSKTKSLQDNIVFPYSYGKSVKFKTNNPIRSYEEIEDLNLGSFNLENFSSTSNRLNPLAIEEKSKRIMNAIGESKLDIVVVQEVLEPAYLEQMVKLHLNNEYKVLYIDNSNNVVDNIAFLVKKDLPFSFKLNSMKDYKRGNRVVFNKDFPILEVKSDERRFFLGGVHLKSKYGGSIENGFYENVRSEQAQSILQIKDKIAQTYGDGTPFIVAGDFNSSLNQGSREFEQLKNQMDDAFDLSLKVPESRITNIAFDQNGQRVSGQIDGILFNKSSKKIIVKETSVYKFESQNGEILDMSYHNLDRNRLPSDHGLLRTKIDLKSLF